MSLKELERLYKILGTGLLTVSLGGIGLVLGGPLLAVLGILVGIVGYKWFITKRSKAKNRHKNK